MDEDRLHAILIEPQLARFHEVCDLQGEDLEVSFSGWHKHIILDRARVFLFPRHQKWVSWLRREAALLAVMDGRSPVVPRLLGGWQDDAISPYPFIATSRLPGKVWGSLEADASFDQVIAMVTSLGRAIAGWHGIDRHELPVRFQRRTASIRSFETDFQEERLRDRVIRAVNLLGMTDETEDRWLAELVPLRRMSRVLVHGDVHEDQLLIDEHFQVTGVLDWETASSGHPLKDFDFGEWGTGIFRWESQFDVLREAMWNAYAAARGIDLPSWRAMHLFFCLRDLPADDDAGDWAMQRRVRILDALQGMAAANLQQDR